MYPSRNINRSMTGITSRVRTSERGFPQAQVSILMPMRNASQYVENAVQSILAEKRIRLELVIVDDGSTDGSSSIVRGIDDARVRLLNGPCKGIAACMNVALNAASGEIVMRCDADDSYPPGRIAWQTTWLAANLSHIAVCGQFSTMDSRGSLVAELFTRSVENLALDVNDELYAGITRTHFCTFAVRRTVALAAGGFREFFETAEDIDFMLRLGGLGLIRYVPLQAYLYRLHDASITHTQDARRRRWFEKTARQFAVQRASLRDDALMLGVQSEPPTCGDEVHPSRAGRQIQDMLWGRAWLQLDRGERRAGFSTAIRALQLSPLRPIAWYQVLKIFMRIVGVTRPGRRKQVDTD